MQKERIRQHTPYRGRRNAFNVNRPPSACGIPCITPTMTSPAVRASTPSLYHVGQVRRNIPKDENDSGTTATGDLDREAIQVSENMTAQGRTKALLQRPQLPKKGLQTGENNGRRSALVGRRPTLHGEEPPGIIDEENSQKIPRARKKLSSRLTSASFLTLRCSCRVPRCVK